MLCCIAISHELRMGMMNPMMNPMMMQQMMMRRP